MIPALLGTGAALSWGTADFIARFTSRDIGPSRSLFGAMLIGAMALTLGLPFSGEALTPTPMALALSLAGGTLNMCGLLMLYAALARGPVTVVAPVIASHPALAVGLLVFLGVMPGPLQWLGMGITLGGLVLLTLAIAGEGSFPDLDRDYVRHTVRLSVIASLIFGVQIVVMQEARLVYGPYATTWLTRLVSVAAILIWASFRRQRLLFPWRAAPRVGFQGILDASGVLLMLAGSLGTDRAVVAVIASSFSAVTVLLARFFLRESMHALQWGAIGIILAGVAVLAAAP